MAIRSAHPTVLVAGAGPTGLTLAAELIRHGVRCRVIDALEQPVIYSKAAVVHARTMEVFEWMGVVEDFKRASKPVHGTNIYAEGERVAHLEFERLDSPYPHPFGISQHETEAILTRHLERLGGHVERGVRLEAFTDDHGIRATVIHTDGSDEVIEPRYIVGCDGAHSRVREILGIPFAGKSYEEHLVQADVRVEWPKPIEGDEIHAFLHPDGALACFPLFTDGRYRLIATLRPGVEVEPTLEAFQGFMDSRGVPGARVSDPAWMVGFRIHCRMVPRYREGDVFLAGDAAHIHSPAGGQGMNMGVQDAFNLAWKLGLVVCGAAPPELLDSYNEERLPIARGTLDATDVATRYGTSVITLRRPIAIELRDQMLAFVSGLEAFRERLSRSISMLDLNYRKSSIVGEDHISLLRTHLMADSEREAPSIGEWMHFGDGPAPGDRAGDVVFSDAGDRLFDLIRGTHHALLLFDGAAATEAGYTNLSGIARAVRERWGNAVDVHVVLPEGRGPERLDWDGSIIPDRDGRLHQKFGARSECAYLIRPDGYVGYRAQPADREKLETYLDNIFV